VFGDLFNSNKEYKNIELQAKEPNYAYSSVSSLTEHDYLKHSVFNNNAFIFLYYVYSQVISEQAKDINSPQSKVIELLDKVSFTPYTFTEKEVLIALCNEIENKKNIQYGVLFWENIVNFYYIAIYGVGSIQDYVFKEVSNRRIISNINDVLVPALHEIYDNDLNKLLSMINNNPWLAALYIVAQSLTVFFNQ